jgi:hypothetical protein
MGADHGLGHRPWRNWWQERPFGGAILTVAGGAEIAIVRLGLPLGSPRLIAPAGLLVAAAIVGCGLLLLFDPVQRSRFGLAVVLLAIVSLTTVHLGGYLAGALLTAAGGAMAFAWVPGLSRAGRESVNRDSVVATPESVRS